MFTVIKSRWPVVLLLVLGLAGILRTVRINSFPVFADEAIYVRWAQVMRSEATLRFLPLSDGKQPLYMWGMIPFLKIISDPLAAGRFFSGLAGIGSALGVALAAFLLFNRPRQAVTSGLLWAVLPYTVFFDRLALSDSLLVLFIVWAFNFMYLATRYLRLDMAMLGGFCLGFAWLTKSPAVFAIALTPSLVLFLPKPKPKNILVACGLWLAAFAIAFAMYNILRLGPEFHMIAIRNRDYVYPLSEILRHPLDPLVPHLRDSFQFYLYLATPFGLIFAVWGMLAEKFTHWRQRLVLSAWWLLPVIVQSFVAVTFTARYLLFSVPFGVILITHALEHLGERTKKHLLVYAGSALIILPSLFIDYQLLFSPLAAPLPRIERAGYLEEWTAGFGLKEIGEYLRAEASLGPVLVGSEGFFGTPFDALKLYTEGASNVRIVGVGVWIDSVHDKLISALVDNRVFLVVNSSRFHADPDKLGLRLIYSYPKAAAPDGNREYLLFFEVLPRK